jgi:hypothetical protein
MPGQQRCITLRFVQFARLRRGIRVAVYNRDHRPQSSLRRNLPAKGESVQSVLMTVTTGEILNPAFLRHHTTAFTRILRCGVRHDRINVF